MFLSNHDTAPLKDMVNISGKRKNKQEEFIPFWKALLAGTHSPRIDRGRLWPPTIQSKRETGLERTLQILSWITEQLWKSRKINLTVSM